MKAIKSTAAFLSILSLALITSTCTDSPTDPDNKKPLPEPYSQSTPPGHSANDFLADSNFTALTVEVDYMEGYAPTPEAINSLQDFLERRLNKTQITINDPTSIPAEGQGPYTAVEVRDLEEEYRDLFTETVDDDMLTAYIIILDGEHESGNVVGFAYYNTSVALFGETIAQISSSGIAPPPREKIEGTVLLHEFGHLFGLVNIDGSGTEMQTPHQDEANGNHCTNEQCLMYWKINTSDFFANIFEGDIPSLDQNCVQDIRANGGE